ncbi:MAG TPA: histidine phosphatase family protein [Acidimicrobiales bacterium]
MATTRLIVMRHASPRHVVEGVWGGPTADKGITDEGRREATLVGRRLARAPWAAEVTVYCSTLARSIETANIVAREMGLAEPAHDCRLCSYHLPPHLDGIAVEDGLADQIPGGGVYKPFERGNEPWISLLARSGEALFDIAQANVGRTAVVVAHGEVVQASLVALGELPIRRHFANGNTPTGITEWTTADDLFDTGYPEWRFPAWTLVRLNDAAHLEHLEHLDRLEPA